MDRGQTVDTPWNAHTGTWKGHTGTWNGHTGTWTLWPTKMRNFPNIFGSEPRPNVFNSPKELNENGEWSMWTVGSIMLEILTYGRLYGEDTNDYTGICARTCWQHSSNIPAKYPFFRLANPGISCPRTCQIHLWNHRVKALGASQFPIAFQRHQYRGSK